MHDQPGLFAHVPLRRQTLTAIWRGCTRAIESPVALALAAILTTTLVAERLPLTATAVVDSTEMFLTSSYGNTKVLLYRNVHGRPFETCASEDQQRMEMRAAVRADLGAVTGSSATEPQKIASALSLYDREARRFYASSCAGGWKRHFDFFDYAYAFPSAAPYLWVIEKLGLTEIHVSLWLLVGAYVGMFCVFLVGRALAGTSLGGLLAVYAFWRTTAWFGIAGNDLVYLLNAFPLVWAAQSVARTRAPARWSFTLVAACSVFAIWAVLTLFTFPITSKMYPWVMVMAVAAVGLVRRDWQCVMRGVLLAALVVTARMPYQWFSSDLLAPASALNTAASAEFLPVTMVGYTFERPSYHGFPIGDYNYFTVLTRDPLLQATPVPNFFHSFRPWAVTYWKDMLLHRPWLVPLHWWRRLVETVGFHHFLAFRLYRDHQTDGTRAFWAGLALLLLAAAADRAGAWPVVMICLFELFGVNVLQGIFHNHALYFHRGILLLWSVMPACALLVLRRGLPLARDIRRWSVAAWAGGRRRAVRRPWLMPVAAVVVVGVVALLWQEARREAPVFRIWTAIDYGLFLPEHYIRHDALVREIDVLKARGALDAGAVSMYAANVMYFQHHGVGYHKAYLKGMNVDFDREAEKARQSMIRYYADALREAPDNPHYYGYAQLMQAPDWANVFAEGLRRFPDHPYAPMMAFALATSGAIPGTAERYGRLFADGMGRFYARTAKYRPGFTRVPAVYRAPGRADDSKRERRRVMVTLMPGETITLDNVATYGSDRMSVLLFAEVARGDAELCLATDQCTGMPMTIGPGTWNPYRRIETGVLSPQTREVRPMLRAGQRGATIALRDLYPLIENPRLKF